MERLPKLTKCCCCASLEQGTLIIGWFEIVSGVLSILGYISSVTTRAPGVPQATTGLIFQSVGMILIGALLVVGVKKKNKSMIKAWLIIEAVILALTVVSGAVVIIAAIVVSAVPSSSGSNTDKQVLTVFAIAFVIIIAVGCTVGFYLILVVLSYYREEFIQYTSQPDPEAFNQPYPYSQPVDKSYPHLPTENNS